MRELVPMGIKNGVSFWLDVVCKPFIIFGLLVINALLNREHVDIKQYRLLTFKKAVDSAVSVRYKYDWRVRFITHLFTATLLRFIERDNAYNQIFNDVIRTYVKQLHHDDMTL